MNQHISETETSDLRQWTWKDVELLIDISLMRENTDQWLIIDWLGIPEDSLKVTLMLLAPVLKHDLDWQASIR